MAKPRQIEISDQAFASLVAIAEWTFETFGAAQAQRYRKQLLDRCHAIAAGLVVHRSCRLAFADHLRDDLRFAICGSHYVVFTESAQDIRIVDFLHQSADISRRLGG